MRRSNRDNKINSADRLFDAIGMIDDRMIAEAENAYSRTPSRKPHTFFRRYAVSLTVVLLVVGMIGGFVVSNMSDQVNSDIFDNDMTGNAANEGVQISQSLDFVLSNVTADTADTVALDEIDFFDGEVSLIWSLEGEDEYHKLTFEAKDAVNTIKSCMSKSTQQISATSTDTFACSVWVSYGNGEVVSPYLKEAAGNVGYSTLFDYSPEVVPSESFTEFVIKELNA